MRALRREDALRVELDALEREGHVADAHDHPIDLGHRGDPELRGERLGIDRQRVVAGGHEARRHAGEEARAIVGDLGRLAMDERRSAHDPCAVGRGHRLHPEADAEERDLARRGDLDRVHGDARVARVARARAR